MEHNVDEILQTVLKLPAETRAFIAGFLIDSLDEEADSDSEAAWEAEVFKRVQELDTGIVEPVSWADARRRMSSK